MSDYQNTYHGEWQQHRLKYIERHFGAEFFKGKTVMELGPFNGYIGNWFHEHGSIVTCVEGREENCNNIRKHFPHLKVIQNTLDVVGWPYGNFDIIVNMGVLYHLETHHEHNLRNCLSHCRNLILETVVNKEPSSSVVIRQEQGIDQSLTGTGGDPSIKWVEDILSSSNATFEMAAIDNYAKHNYKGLSSGDRYNRRMWIVTTNAQL